ncbi:transposase [Ruminococcus bicirculans (ex Wegman et al. 2014)]|uniref:transposase n=1 Tax=Ruminococcus bicirculans (ex Wegman et al. 2014) TaxID=1160721 RepID=UPI0034634FD6
MSEFPEYTAKTGRNGFSKRALLCAFIVMKCECFSCITDLIDYLNNNLIIAHYCGFNIMKPLPSHRTVDRFILELNNDLLKKLMKSQVLKLSKMGIIDTSFIALDSTPVSANTRQNNPKSFAKNKFSKDNQPRSDKDCGLGVHTASNQHNERNFEYYWGYKNHILVDCITGLPIYELTTSDNVSDSTAALDILSQTNSFLSVDECTFLADKGYDVKAIYNTVKELYHGEYVIPLNKRNTKDPKKLASGHPICEAGLAMHKNGKLSDNGRTRQKYCCPLKNSKCASCPCDHKNWNNGKKHRGCTKYVTISDDYRLSIDRECISFKKLYALRTEAERYNSRFKQTGQERLWGHSFNAAQNLNSVAHIALLAVALAAIVTKSNSSYRCLKSVKRIA